MIGGHGRTANPDAAPARPGPRAASQDRPRGERRNRPAQRGRVPVRRRRGAQLRAPERRRSRRRAAPRRTDLVVPLPQGAPRSRRPGSARHGLRLSGPRAGRSPRGLRLFLVGPGGVDRGGHRRARPRPHPPRRPRHRRPDRLRVGDPQPRPGSVAHRAQHVRGRRQLPQAVADASVLDQGDRRGLASRLAPVALLGDLLLAGDRGAGRWSRAPTSTPTWRWCGCATAAARS